MIKKKLAEQSDFRTIGQFGSALSNKQNIIQDLLPFLAGFSGGTENSRSAPVCAGLRRSFFKNFDLVVQN
jgi:hypothetical protein